MSKLGQKGGKVSGERRMENLTQEKRSEIALKAVKALGQEGTRKRGSAGTSLYDGVDLTLPTRSLVLGNEGRRTAASRARALRPGGQQVESGVAR